MSSFWRQFDLHIWPVFLCQFWCQFDIFLTSIAHYGKTSSKKNNSGRKVNVRDSRSLRWLVSKQHRTTTASDKKTLIFSLKTPFPQKPTTESFTKPPPMKELKLQSQTPVLTCEKHGVVIIKPGQMERQMNFKIWLEFYQTTVDSFGEKMEKQILSSNISEATGRCSER